MDDADRAHRLDVALTEFKALRDEINQRATYCHTIININVVAAGTLASFALANNSRLHLLLILPVLGPVLGLLWLDHSYAIRNMGDYIASTLRPLVGKELAAAPWALGWETYLDEHEKGHKVLRFLPLGLPIGLLFAGIPVASLARVVPVLSAGWGWAVWSLGVVLTVAFLLMWLRFLLRPWSVGRSTAFSGARRRNQKGA